MEIRYSSGPLKSIGLRSCWKRGRLLTGRECLNLRSDCVINLVLYFAFVSLVRGSYLFKGYGVKNIKGTFVGFAVHIFSLSLMTRISCFMNCVSSQMSLSECYFLVSRFFCCAFNLSQFLSIWLRTHKQSRFRQSSRTSAIHNKFPAVKFGREHSYTKHY